ncbi:EAL domain-containing protein [Thiocystis violacea]|uniref:EAL domain-containing protein n=1 Tax=Thiocystis violacea TaxID=13725 RepID=UPI0019068F66|nr:EAL domain-containing protein [Thiocystis violacea]MBK1718887.1 GGDEF domain-containing protein [Thiocystis violacea]
MSEGLVSSQGEEDAEEPVIDLLGLSPEELRERALVALRQHRFNLADELLRRGDLGLDAMVENLRVYQAELEIQNEELVRGQQQVQEALARFTSFFNTLPVAELVIDRKGLVREANLEAQRLFNLRTAHFNQHFFIRLIDEADRSSVVGAWSDLFGDQSLVIPEVRFRVSREGGFIGDLHIAPIPGLDPELHQYVCAIVDRTEAVRQRQSLFETSERLRLSETSLRDRLKELATLHQVLTLTGESQAPLREVLQRVVECLPSGWRHPGLVEARIRLPEVSAATPGFTESAWMRTVPIPLAGGSVGDVTVLYRELPPGEGGDPFLVEEGQLLDSVATHVSVYLARMRDEEGLRDSRERYRVLADFSSDWEFWLGPDGRYIYISPACARISGYPPEDFMADPDLLRRLIPPADQERWNDHARALEMEPSADLECLEFRIQSRDGAEHWIEHICNPVIREDGRFLGRRGVNRDITERKRFEDELKRSEGLLLATGRMAKVGGWEYDSATKSLRWTSGTLDFIGVELGETPGLEDVLTLFHPRDQSGLRAALERALSLGEPFDMEARLAPGGDRQRAVQITCEPFRQEDGAIKLLGAAQDITIRVEAEKSLRQAARVFESTAEGVLITDPEGRILAVNRAFTEITGYDESEALGRSPRLLRSGRHGESFYRAMWEDLTRTGQWRGEIWNRHKQGRIYPELLTISAVLDGAGELTHYVAVFSDISQIKHSEEQLEYLAHHDPLTGLPNRSLFQTRLEQCIQRAKRYRRRVGLLFLDLDRFKEVNDTLGHHVGDGLLKQVAEVLSRQVREVDTIARLGGDEFVIILEDIPAARFAATFADRVMEDFARPFLVEGRELFITASIGISLYPDDGAEIETLVRHADIAMYQAKNGGRNGFSFFEPSMSEGAVERLHLEHDLRLAIKRDEFVLHYQPQLALDSGELRGVETLCRWNHPQLGLLPPEMFIPLAEDIGLIDELGLWVLDRGCRQIVDWDRAGFRVPRLAVNLSVREIERPRLVSQIQEILQRTGLDPARLELEVTESKIMRRAEAATSILRSLRALGVTLAIDDFGTGYSSLAYLKRLPLNRLKIDRSFIDRLTHDHNDDAIVRAIIALADSLGLAVLAEGVETPEQSEFLFREGCGEGQGYLYSRPLAAEHLVATWLEER